MKISVLCENTTKKENILSEHGLSLFIETEKHKILFDMGQSDAFLKNAKTLGIDLSTVDIAILSHGHYDHGGGLRAFLEYNEKALQALDKINVSQERKQALKDFADKIIKRNK
jgi:7,8-dihydropterin-6-yl-methyl-4-(beta-D-ribofuranosyl)aminobenzene 5'-phosphate synthase